MVEITPYIHQVQYYETDKMGITHHSNYVRWMEEARIDYLSKLGWDYAKLEESGIISPVTSIDVHYKGSTTYPDVVTIEVLIRNIKGVRLQLEYVMKNEEGKIVCQAGSEHCFLNREGRPVRLEKECPEFYAALSGNQVEEN
ncbi:MAG: acyl-CoA thioesterase [Clostridiales bacterium]|nr:acyl-CoA thioesterase [Clostridiales bacterium]